MSKTTTRLAYLIGDLRAVQAKINTKLDYENMDEAAINADERRSVRLANDEDAAYSAIGRCQSRTLAELHAKLNILFEGAGDALGPFYLPLPNGKIGGASSEALADLARGVQADAARLLAATSRRAAA